MTYFPGAWNRIIKLTEKNMRETEEQCKQKRRKEAENEGGMTMLTKRRHNPQEVISIEEYLNKRQQIREQEEKKKNIPQSSIEKNSALMLAELYI